MKTVPSWLLEAEKCQNKRRGMGRTQVIVVDAMKWLRQHGRLEVKANVVYATLRYNFKYEGKQGGVEQCLYQMANDKETRRIKKVRPGLFSLC